jgi:hypothetical protein
MQNALTRAKYSARGVGSRVGAELSERAAAITRQPGFETLPMTDEEP